MTQISIYDSFYEYYFDINLYEWKKNYLYKNLNFTVFNILMSVIMI